MAGVKSGCRCTLLGEYWLRRHSASLTTCEVDSQQNLRLVELGDFQLCHLGDMIKETHIPTWRHNCY